MTADQAMMDSAGWAAWVFWEVIDMAGNPGVGVRNGGPDIVEASRRLVNRVADPRLCRLLGTGGGLWGVVVLVAEALEARDARDDRLSALATAVMMDPHGRGTAAMVAECRRLCGLPEPT